MKADIHATMKAIDDQFKDELQIFGREHLNVNEATKSEIIKRFNTAPEMLRVLKLIANTQYRANKAGKVDRIEINHCIQLAKLLLKDFESARLAPSQK